MDLALTAEQELIRDEAARFLAEACSSQAVRRMIERGASWDAELWQRMAGELGWCGLAVPEALGGAGLSWLDFCLVVEQAGAHLAPVPLLGCAGMAVAALSHAASGDAAASLLRRLAAGDEIAVLALPERAFTAELAAHASGGEYRISGRIARQLDGDAATLLLAAAMLDGAPALFAIACASAGVVVTPLAVLDATRGLADIVLDNAPALLLGTGARVMHGVERARDLARIALAAEAVGVAQASFDLTLAYLAQRVQFGRAIASFQAIKHRMAALSVQIETARSACYGAAILADSADRATLEIEAAAAQGLALECALHVTGEAIQLHGGVGFTWEYDPQLYFKRAHGSAHLLGSAEAAYGRIATALLDG